MSAARLAALALESYGARLYNIASPTTIVVAAVLRLLVAARIAV